MKSMEILGKVGVACLPFLSLGCLSSLLNEALTGHLTDAKLFGDIHTVIEPKHLYNVTESVTLNPGSTTCQLGDAGRVTLPLCASFSL